VCFPRQGNVSLIEPQTYLYYMRSPDLVSLPSRGEWKPFDDAAERVIVEDHKRLWATNFLDDLSIESVDYPFSNGVIGKVIIYNMEERQRIKSITYNEGTKEVDQTKVEERLRELSINMRLDTFVDPGTEKRVANVIRELMMEKGFQDAKVEPVHEPLPGSPKSVALKFRVTEGPKVRLSNVDFVGNKVFSDGKLKGKMKTNKGGGWWIFPGSSVYQADKFEEDADMIVAFFREHGYLQGNVGQPTLKPLRDSSDGKTRYVTLEIPISEGTRYRVEKLEFAGNDKVPSDLMRPLFKMKPGDYYNEKRLREGFEKVREIYGAGGHWEMTPLPDFRLQRRPGERDAADQRRQAVLREPHHVPGQHHDPRQRHPARDTAVRERRVQHRGAQVQRAPAQSAGVLQALEEQKHVQIDKTPGSDSKVDLTMKLEEQNRNQLSFGAGVSQYDGVFGQLSFSTANFMGRGETFTVSLQSGARASDYQVAFTEPFLFDRPITGSVDLHKRNIQYIDQFTQGSTGGNITMGFPLRAFSRFFVQYSYDRVNVSDLNEAFFNRDCYFTEEGCKPIDVANLTEIQRAQIESSPYLKDALLVGQGGRRVISKVVPTFTHNSVDNPITPTTGRRYTASLGVAAWAATRST
jgi:outer membrane protein insertion porin family